MDSLTGVWARARGTPKRAGSNGTVSAPHPDPLPAGERETRSPSAPCLLPSRLREGPGEGGRGTGRRPGRPSAPREQAARKPNEPGTLLPMYPVCSVTLLSGCSTASALPLPRGGEGRGEGAGWRPGHRQAVFISPYRRASLQPPNRFPNFSVTRASSSALLRTTAGKSSPRAKGRQASTTTRALRRSSWL